MGRETDFSPMTHDDAEHPAGMARRWNVGETCKHGISDCIVIGCMREERDQLRAARDRLQLEVEKTRLLVRPEWGPEIDRLLAENGRLRELEAAVAEWFNGSEGGANRPWHAAITERASVAIRAAARAVRGGERARETP